MFFDEARLDDSAVLDTADLRLRGLAESGARIRREAVAASHLTGAMLDRFHARPRAIVAAGPNSRLLRTVMEPTCPVPLVAWPSPGLPGWAGALDLVVVLAPDGGDAATMAALAEARRRGCQVMVAAPEASAVADFTDGGDAVLIPVVTRDQLAVAVSVLGFLADLGLGPRVDPEAVARCLDDVAVASSPHREITSNPGKMLALGIAESSPVLWGGSMVAARAARRFAESLRRASGRSAFAGDYDQVEPVLEAARIASIFDDPYGDGLDTPGTVPPVLVLLDDGSDDPVAADQRRRLVALADARSLRVEVMSVDFSGEHSAEAATDISRYATLILAGQYAAEYLRLGLIQD